MGNVSLLSTDEPDTTASQGLAQEDDGSGSADEQLLAAALSPVSSDAEAVEDSRPLESVEDATTPSVKRALSTARAENTKRSKASQGEHIERELVAFSDGLRAIGERITSSTTEQNKTNEMLNAIREQTNSIQALLQFLKNKAN
ncbi:hypothetical protein L915_00960 [Phytophthora nicotianae]|uniref:Uncharacterized protein n=1 Tax=Phytophthora nicotianae TaxID=4792 RepID=W2HM40_PHYNI|nr:hypothetical protein L915_00960 [Phytophthora nicotianae]